MISQQSEATSISNPASAQTDTRALIEKTSELSFPVLSALVAIIILAAFGYLAWDLINFAKNEADKSLQWTQLMSIFSSIEALVFAAAGWLFGTNIERGRGADVRRNLSRSRKSLSVSNREKEDLRNAMETLQSSGSQITHMLRQSMSSEMSVSSPAELLEILEVAERSFNPNRINE